MGATVWCSLVCEVLDQAGVDVVKHGIDGEVAAVGVLLGGAKLRVAGNSKDGARQGGQGGRQAAGWMCGRAGGWARQTAATAGLPASCQGAAAALVSRPSCCLPGSPTVMVGMRLWWAYSSLRRLTRSIQMPRTCRQAVRRTVRQARRQAAGGRQGCHERQ